MKKEKDLFPQICLTAVMGGLFFYQPEVLSAREALIAGSIRLLLTWLLLLTVRLAACRWQKALLLRGWLAAVFLLSAAFDLSNLQEFYREVYPRQLPDWLLCALLLAAAWVLALGDDHTLGNLSRLLLPMLALSGVILLFSCGKLFHLNNLKSDPVSAENWKRWAQVSLWPELLALALMGDRTERRPLLYLPGVRIGAGAIITLLGELALGGSTGRWPAHDLSLLGQLSVFNRLEWLQVLSWVLLICAKLAFSLYVVTQLWPEIKPIYPALLIFVLALAADSWEKQLLWKTQQALLWGLVTVILARGVCLWKSIAKQRRL